MSNQLEFIRDSTADSPKVSLMRAGGLPVLQASIAKDIIFRYKASQKEDAGITSRTRSQFGAT
jgi:hypothetical protein